MLCRLDEMCVGMMYIEIFVFCVKLFKVEFNWYVLIVLYFVIGVFVGEFVYILFGW